MKTYSYFNKNKVLLAKSDSPIEFNTKLFPIFKDIEPVVTEAKSSYKPKSTGTNKTEEKKK